MVTHEWKSEGFDDEGAAFLCFTSKNVNNHSNGIMQKNGNTAASIEASSEGRSSILSDDTLGGIASQSHLHSSALVLLTKIF